MEIILTMAGKYERFRKDGYKVPKYLLPWGSETILSKIISNLKHECISNLYLIANKNDEIYFPHILDHLRKFNIPRSNLLYINNTSGQAETTKVAINLLKKHNLNNQKFCISNIDTILYGRDLKEISKILDSCNIYIDTFKSNNKDYSYVLANEVTHEAYDIIEKKVISNFASSGMYGFSSYEIFLDFYYHGDIYISDIIKRAITNNISTKIGNIYTENDTLVLGTPAEYENNSIFML